MTCQFIVLIFLLAIAVSANIQTKKIAPKIVEGRKTDITVVPYQVSLQLDFWHNCGGSIIDPSWILTAAHCVRKGTAGNYSVRAGTSIHYLGGVVVQVSKIIKHPNYDVNITNNYDVALVELETPLKIGRKIKTISLTDFEPQRGDQLLISGWGSVNEIGYYSDTLQSTVVPVVSNSKCKKLYGFFRPVTPHMICAGFTKGGKDSCQGDSGGPAVFNHKLVGIVSWGTGCARRNYPGVYANVAAVRAWIESQIK